jgi:hypothetical protein
MMMLATGLQVTADGTGTVSHAGAGRWARGPAQSSSGDARTGGMPVTGRS